MSRRRRLGMPAALAFAAGLAVLPAAAQSPPPGALACSGCHGPGAGAIPSLAGRSAGEIAAAMHGFRDGTRPATLMNRIAKGFSAQETEAIAQWLALQK